METVTMHVFIQQNDLPVIFVLTEYKYKKNSARCLCTSMIYIYLQTKLKCSLTLAQTKKYVCFRLPTVPKFRSPTLIFLLSFLVSYNGKCGCRYSSFVFIKIVLQANKIIAKKYKK